MSAYLVHKLCRRVLHDPEFRELALSDPEKAVSQFPFLEDERKALLSGDVGSLYCIGASAFLLLILSRFEVFGLKLSIFNKRMRALDANQDKNLGGNNGCDRHGESGDV